MFAIQIFGYGPPDVLRFADAPTPRPGPGEILVKIAAAGVNPADYKWREGMFQARAPMRLPHILGYDAAGIVVGVGGAVERFTVGDRAIVHLDNINKGGYAEFAARDASVCAIMPDRLDMAVAASLPTAGLTGTQLIEEHVRPEPGQTVLITGATGAVGRFALHAAISLGVDVVAAVRRSRFAEVERLGAKHIIELGGAVPDNLSFDHVADTVGGPDVAHLCSRIRPGGRIVTAATTEIAAEGLTTLPIFMAVHPDADRLEKLAIQVASGKVEVPVACRLPLAEAAKAHRMLEAGGVGGKIVLMP